ncbi:DUF736 domain-containing protein [Bradyrhizobium yuanmingense]|uniref:DUF736 domain-containing protein n=1 Tax=Bradyrhizobium yuanmingense TaxID=108015 RepID=UPI003D2F0163
MASIRTFTKTGNNEIIGGIVTLSLQARNVRIAPETNRSGENRATGSTSAVGDQGRPGEGLQRGDLKLDDPSFTPPIFANLPTRKVRASA